MHDKTGTRGTGLGLPPEEYRQNADECENSPIKKLKESKVLTIKEAIQLIKKKKTLNSALLEKVSEK